MPAPRVWLVHRKPAEAEPHATALRAAGFRADVVSFEPFPSVFRKLKTDMPDALVIDLDRTPSLGRDVAIAVRDAKALRHIPIVFCGGEPDKIAGVRRHLPDATYATWRGLRGAVRRALAKPLRDPVVPEHRLAGYSGTPLPRKLGIKQDASVLLLGAPEGFESLLAPLPPGAGLRRDGRGKGDLVLWFVRSQRDLHRKLAAVKTRTGTDGLWICWPKKASGVETDVSEPIIRAAGLASGLVDYKIAALDSTWSGLKFTRRRGGA